MQESVLLRTLGANRKQIFAITALEYFFLGAFAAATGIVIALGGGWALAHYTFETTFTPELLPILIPFMLLIVKFERRKFLAGVGSTCFLNIAKYCNRFQKCEVLFRGSIILKIDRFY